MGAAARLLFTVFVAVTLLSGPAVAQGTMADVRLMRDRIRACLVEAGLTSFDPIRNPEPASDRERRYLSCSSAAFRACQDREFSEDVRAPWECWELERRAWGLIRQHELGELRRTLILYDGWDTGEALQGLTEADAAWLANPYGDCAYFANRFDPDARGNFYEAFQCPLHAEAQRAVTYILWRESFENIYGPVR